MPVQKTFLVFGGTGATGRHFVSQALEQGHRVRALARNTAKLPAHNNLEAHTGSVTEIAGLDSLLDGVDNVVAMLGDVEAQKTRRINTEFVKVLIPAMRRTGVKRFLYQAGGLSAAPGRKLSPELWVIRSTIARSFIGQHRDNEAVMQYLVDEAMDIEWMVHRAGIGGDGSTKGLLLRSETRYSVATFRDVAAYNHRILDEESAIHTSEFSSYQK